MTEIYLQLQQLRPPVFSLCVYICWQLCHRGWRMFNKGKKKKSKRLGAGTTLWSKPEQRTDREKEISTEMRCVCIHLRKKLHVFVSGSHSLTRILISCTYTHPLAEQPSERRRLWGCQQSVQTDMAVILQYNGGVLLPFKIHTPAL